MRVSKPCFPFASICVLLAALTTALHGQAREAVDRRPADPAARGPEAGIKALQNLAGQKDPAAAADLTRFLTEAEDPLLRAQAAALLGILGGEESVAALSAALDDPAASVRVHAVRALGKLEGVKAVPVLRDILIRDPDARVRRGAVRWLAALPGDEARAAVEAAASDPDASVRREVARALATWGKHLP
jgi:HEAT repeat protein